MRLADDDENAPGQIAKITFNAKDTEAAEKNQRKSAISACSTFETSGSVSVSMSKSEITEVTEKSQCFGSVHSVCSAVTGKPGHDESSWPAN